MKCKGCGKETPEQYCDKICEAIYHDKVIEEYLKELEKLKYLKIARQASEIGSR